MILYNLIMKTMASIESFTGGLFASEIIAKPGASNYFKGSIVLYSNEMKQKFGINTINGVISKEVALKMSSKGKKYFGVDICVSFTGNSGPDCIEDKPVGLVYIAINEVVYEKQFLGTRNEIRMQAVEFVFKELNNYL